MVGTMPPTRLLLVCNDVVIGHFQSYADIAMSLGISVSDDGIVTFMGITQHPGFVMKKDEHKYGVTGGWESKSDVIKDWAKYHMKLPHGYRIYRYLT